MTNPQKNVAQLIKNQIGNCPTIQTAKLSKSECIEFDGSVEQLQECIYLLQSGKYTQFYITETSYGYYGFKFVSVETNEEYKARISLERTAVKIWEAAKKEIVENYKNKMQEEKKKRNEKYKNASYIEYLRLKKIFEDKE